MMMLSSLAYRRPFIFVAAARWRGRCDGHQYLSTSTATRRIVEKVQETTVRDPPPPLNKDTVPIAASLIAAALGIATVSAAAAVTEAATADTCPPYQAYGQRFSQTNFVGRFARMLLGCDPRLLLYNMQDVKACQEKLEMPVLHSDRELWEARRVVDAALHPDTGECIPRPFRLSGYVPYNGPINVAMVSASSTTALLFWSWVNQSQNALVNYYNRNAGAGAMSNETLATSYAAAVGSALAVAFGLAQFVQRRYDATRARAMMKFVAFPSAVVASTLNCYIVRRPEIATGIPLVDASGVDVLPGETSSVAAARGVYATTASRALLQVPVYFVPPLLLTTVPPLKAFLVKSPRLTVPVTTYLLLVSFGVGLPATVALFPQVAEIDAADVEPKFQNLRQGPLGLVGAPYDKFYYNKGL